MQQALDFSEFDDAFIERHRPMIKRFAYRSNPEALLPSIDGDDLYQEGAIALMTTAIRHDPARNVSLASYAKHRVRGAMVDTLRNSSKLNFARGPRPDKEDGDENEPATITRLVEFSDPHFEWQESAAASTLQADSPEHCAARAEMRRILIRAMATLQPRDLQLIWLLYVKGYGAKEAGQKLVPPIGESRVSQLSKRFIGKLRRELKMHGVNKTADLLSS